MAADRPNYRLGEKGVNIVASPVHTPEGGLLKAENVEFIRDFGIGGIGSRGGLAPVNDTALAGAVLAVANIPLVISGAVVGNTQVPGAQTMVAPRDGDPVFGTWHETVNGTTWAPIYAASPVTNVWNTAGAVFVFSLSGVNSPASSALVNTILVDAVSFPMWRPGEAPSGNGIEWDPSLNTGTVTFRGTAQALVAVGAHTITITYVPAGTAARMASTDKFPATVTIAGIPPTQRIAIFDGKVYYPGNDYLIADAVSPFVGNTAAPILMFTGKSSFEQFRMPPNAQGVGPCRWITDMMVAYGSIFIAMWDLGGVAPNHFGRVVAYNPDTGALTQIGIDSFGSAAVQGGMPFCLATFAGALWAGTYGVSGAGALGRIYRITVNATVGIGVDYNWTVDKTALAASGYFMSLCEYNGNLYAASNANDAAFTARIEKRTPDGVWSLSFTGPDAGAPSYCSSLFVFNGLLFAAFFKDTVRSLVKVFDGTTWTTDKNVGVDFANLSAAPGQPFLFNGAMYWPFRSNSGFPGSSFILKRTTAGVWSQVLTSTDLRGLLSSFILPGTT